MANPMYTVTAIPNRSAYGSVTGSVTEAAGTVTVLTATPNTNYAFCCWSDGTTDNPYRFKIPEKDVVIKAFFYQVDPLKYLLDLTGLSSFWNKVKTWFGEKSSGISGAKQIGFCKTGTTYTGEEVQTALEEVKSQSDTNATNISNLKTEVETEYVKRSPDDVISNPQIFLNGTVSYSPVPAGTRYSNAYTYFSGNDDSSIIAFTEVPAAKTDYDSNKTYYKFDITTGEYTYYAVSGNVDYLTNRDELYYVYDYAHSKTWDEWLTTGIYTRTTTGTTSNTWRSYDHQPHQNGMKHSGVMTVTTGFNNGCVVNDLTINKAIGRVDAKDKYGQGTETITVMVVKGHNYSVQSWSGGHGNSCWEQITLTMFGD